MRSSNKLRRKRGRWHLKLPVSVIVALPVVALVVLLTRTGGTGLLPEPGPKFSVTPTQGVGKRVPSPTVAVSLATAVATATDVPTVTSSSLTAISTPTHPPVTAVLTAVATSTIPATPTTVVTTTIASPMPTAPPVPTATFTPMPMATPTPLLVVIPTAVPESEHGPKDQKLVAIDPGHGGEYSGAAHRDDNGQYDVIEKDVNLRVRLLLSDMLKEAGYGVVSTRSGDTTVNTSGQDLNGDGQVTVEDDLQARVDLINNHHADLLLSIHHNGSEATPLRGATSYYCASRPFAERNRILATGLQAGLLVRLQEAGYAGVPDLGVRDDTTIGKPHGHLCLIGPTTPVLARASEMPGVVGEALFVSDDLEASLLKQDRVLRAIALAYRDAVEHYFEREP